MQSIGQNTKRRILVVDDNIDGAVTTAELLKILGNEVEVAHAGLAALDAVFSMQPEIVLLDIGLPDIDGYEVARRIRENNQIDQPVLIALTGWDQEKHALSEGHTRFDDHMVKPIDLERLIGAINQQFQST
jgi:CheY-like chemotaxis protein